MKRLTLLFAICLFAESVYCQENQNPPKEYRIVAKRRSNPDVESISNTLKLYLPMKIYVPTAFTPNGDGLNDSFGVVGEGIEKYSLIVYDRWGQVVFQTSSIDHKWDGNKNGMDVPTGEYSYQLIAYGKEIGEVFKSGSVMLIN
jgi:gliding motility-associated-like protein